jgi:hypothetical protein
MSTAGKLVSGAHLQAAEHDHFDNVGAGRSAGKAGTDDRAGKDRHQVEPMFLRELPGFLFGQGFGAVIRRREVGAPVVLGRGPATRLHHRHRHDRRCQHDPSHAASCGGKQGAAGTFNAVAHHLIGLGRAGRVVLVRGSHVKEDVDPRRGLFETLAITDVEAHQVDVTRRQGADLAAVGAIPDRRADPVSPVDERLHEIVADVSVRASHKHSFRSLHCGLRY